MKNQNGCYWPECNVSHYPSGRADLMIVIPPCPQYPVGVNLCRDHFELINTIAFFLMLSFPKNESPNKMLEERTQDI